MTMNRETRATWTYHDGTKHSFETVRSGSHVLDFSNQPLPFKIYEDLEAIPLPRDMGPITVPALTVVAATGPAGPAAAPDLSALARLLHLAAGITRVRRGPGWEIGFRAASCTGALYHIELYLVCGDLPGLPAGVYHFGVHDFALRRLRAGDFRSRLVQASGQEPAVARAPAILACTTTFWRNAWKYQARAYRHAFWDSGTILANLLAAAVAQHLPARVVLGFVDEAVNALLDLDTEREVGLALVPVGAGGTAAEASPPVAPLYLSTARLSRREVDYPAVRAMHAASCLVTGEEAAAWHGGAPAEEIPTPAGPVLPLRPSAEAQAPADSLTNVILRRGSTRRFAARPIHFEELSTILDRASRGIPADFLEPPGTTLNSLYLIANAVEGLAPGTYVYHRRERALELLREGLFRREAGYLGLEQELPAQAAVNIYCLAHLPPILARFGNRGYRAAQLEGGILGGKIYLTAYAERLGATGLTFYDDEVTEFFSPHAAGKSVMFLTAVGRPARRTAGLG